jgi:pilus assembly protein CpaB
VLKEHIAMNTRWAVIALICLGVIAAVSAALLMVSFQVRPGSGAGGAAAQRVEILTATKALPAMTVVDADSLKKATVTKKEAPPGCFTNAVQVVGKVLIMPVAEGQALTPDCFLGEDSAAQLAAAIPPGRVAVSLAVGEYGSLEGSLYPGCLVDVLMTLAPDSTNTLKDAICATILQAVKVLAIDDQSVASPAQGPQRLTPARRGEQRMVTLALTPEEAKKLQLARERGKISLALRNPLQPLTNDGGAVRLSELLGPAAVGAEEGVTTTQPELLPPVKGAGPRWEILLIQGGVREVRSLPLPDAGDHEVQETADK